MGSPLGPDGRMVASTQASNAVRARAQPTAWAGGANTRCDSGDLTLVAGQRGGHLHNIHLARTRCSMQGLGADLNLTRNGDLPENC